METLADKSLPRYPKAGLESADELVGIWFEVRSYPSVFKEVSNASNDDDPSSSEGMVRWNLRRYAMDEAAQTAKIVRLR